MKADPALISSAPIRENPRPFCLPVFIPAFCIHHAAFSLASTLCGVCGGFSVR
jgi:hypothetical protein